MVGAIDIREINLEELIGVVNIYPWFASARMELCRRMAAEHALSDSMVSQTAMYVGSRAFLFSLMRAGRTVDCSDSRVTELLKDYLESGNTDASESRQQAAEPENAPQRRIYIAGGDYFSQDQYKGVRRPDDGIFSSFAKDNGTEPSVEQEQVDPMDFCTETLAQVYLEQDYVEEAKQIYSRLGLRYPEKSVYFAALIENLNNQSNKKI